MHIYSSLENHMLYTLYESSKAYISPFRNFAKLFGQMFKDAPLDFPHMNSLLASLVLFERTTRHYGQPEFDIKSVTIDDKLIPVAQEVVQTKTFCDLIHFRKPDNFAKQEKMLLVAPMSGHYSTLLRGTVAALLPHYDVYITDWKNVRDIELSKGDFTFDDFVDYCIDFIDFLGTKIHVTAVCQPAVPVYAAACILSERSKTNLPLSIIMMGGPIDTRHNPTDINDFAIERKLKWFENNMITLVPVNYKGFMRRVYPGFLQLAGFMAMNLQIHLGEHFLLFKHLVEGDGDSVEKHKKFYNEYLSVMDLPAEFYIQTVDIVFKNHLLPKGELESRGRKINPKSIENIPILCIEGEKDDISGIGQTKAALDISVNLPKSMKQYHLQKDVGHYGIFNGKRFREQIVPVMCKFANQYQRRSA